MYIPKAFEVEDQDRIFDFMEAYGFALVISQHEGKPFATHVPLLLNRGKGTLYGHFARANPQWQSLVGQEVLVVFQGPHHYISSSWYETNRSVPTWNYAAVHAYGAAELVQDGESLLADLQALVRRYEGQDGAYRIDESNRDFVDGLMKGIVGFRIRIDRLEGKWKLSQNHSPERRERVIGQLERLPGDDAKAIAQMMREQRD